MHNARTGFPKVFVDVQVTNVDRFDHLKPMAKNAANTMQFAADQCNSAKLVFRSSCSTAPAAAR